MNNDKHNNSKNSSSISPDKDLFPAFQSKSRNKKLLYSIITSFIYISIAALIMTGYAVYKSDHLYKQIKCTKSVSKIYTDDEDMGFAMINDFRPQSKITRAHDSLRYEQFGFWEPVNTTAPSGKVPVILSLGCSFTYGFGCKAEETYTYLVGNGLNGVSLNAGLEGAGLSQMLLLGRKLIPKYKPDYVLVQYSPWLARRAAYFFSSIRTDWVPVPYFADASDGKIFLHPPVYRTKLFRIPLKYRYSPLGKGDYFSFMFKAGIPLYLCEQVNIIKLRVMQLFKIVPPPTQQYAKIVELVYNELEEICRANNSKLIIVLIGGPGGLKSEDFPKKQMKKLLEIKNVTIIDCSKPLFEKLRAKTPEEYTKTYNTVINTNPIMTDTHPNKTAHKIIAEEIFKNITGVKEP